MIWLDQLLIEIFSVNQYSWKLWMGSRENMNTIIFEILLKVAKHQQK
jgi:hypothetical protein